jgi:cell wall-associated NlpC family hydrolase
MIIDIKDNKSLETGDIILFRGTGIIATILEYFGKSKYSHVGMILKNPKFLNDSLEDGIYLLESSYNDTPDSEDHKLKLGVQIHKLEDVLKEYPKNSVYVRKVHCERNDDFYKKLIDIHTEIHNKSYDLNLFDWICAKCNLDKEFPSNPLYKKTNTFWCSALVSYIFRELGLIKEDINWTLMAPREFSSDEGKYITFLCEVDKEILYY